MKRCCVLALFLLFANSAFGQLTYLPTPVAFPQIAVGGDPAGLNYVALVQFVNNNSITTTGQVVLYSDTGTGIPALFDGQGPQSSIDITLESGEARQIEVTLNGTITAGWMSITFKPADALTTVILQLRSGTTLLSEVGVDAAFGTLSNTDFAAETDATLNTGIAVANPTNSTGYVLARLWSPDSGDQMAASAINLPPNGHIARLLTELFPNVTTIAEIRARVSLDSCSDSSCTFIGGAGFIATAIRLNRDQFTTIPLAPRTTTGTTTRIFPQVAFGGLPGGPNIKTVLYFTTNVTTGVFGTAEIFDDNGNPLSVSADGGAFSSSLTFTVAGNRVNRIVLSGDQTVRSGWMRLTLPSAANLVTSAVFQTFNGTSLVSEASVLESMPTTRSLVYVKSQLGAGNVGLAFANSQSTANPVVLDLFNREGFVQVSARTITLPPNGHLAQFITEIFPELASLGNFDGAVSIHSSTAFSVTALRLSLDKVATVAVAANGMYRPSITGLRITRTQRAPAEVVFEIDARDYDSDLATTSSSSVTANVFLDFGAAGAVTGSVVMDGAGMANAPLGMLTGTYRPSLSGAVPAGQHAVLYLHIVDSLGNTSHAVAYPFQF